MKSLDAFAWEIFFRIACASREASRQHVLERSAGWCICNGSRVTQLFSMLSRIGRSSLLGPHVSKSVYSNAALVCGVSQTLCRPCDASLASEPIHPSLHGFTTKIRSCGPHPPDYL